MVGSNSTWTTSESHKRNSSKSTFLKEETGHGKGAQKTSASTAVSATIFFSP